MSTIMPNITTQKVITKAVMAIHFSWFDHTIFSFMLISSALIGIWFAFCGKKDNSTIEYLLGGKTMGVFPTALSLTASCISGSTILGLPADIYMYGTSYWFGTIDIFLVGLITAYVYLPVFYKLQLTSSYEYLQLRFDSRIRIGVSVLSSFTTILFTPIVIYVPALAFSQVTGFNLHLITPIVCAVCIFYTSIGGLKAVVWTDAIQFLGILGGAITVLVLGIKATGGLSRIWEIAEQRDRIDFFNMDPDPTLRNSFWSIMIGLFALWMCGIAVNQATVQRLLSVPTIKDARISIAIFTTGMVIAKGISCLTGLIIFAKYSDCDPLQSKQVERADQLLPFFVMDIAGHVSGFPGIFIAGVFSAALSTMSTVLNSMAAVIYEDYLSPFMPKDITEGKINLIMKTVVVVIGVLGTAMVYIVEHLGGILQLGITLGGICSGPVLGLFTLGMLFPRANTKGALWGGLVSCTIMAIIMFGSQYHIAKGNIVYPPKPLSIEGCDFPINISQITNFTNPVTAPYIFRISYYYYAITGTLLVILVGYPISLMTRSKSDVVHPDLLSPVIHWLLPMNQRRSMKEPLMRIELRENNGKADDFVN